VKGLGLRVKGLWNQGSGLRTQGPYLRGLRCRVWGIKLTKGQGFDIQDYVSGLRVEERITSLGLRVEGLGFRV